jgi:hypothetical protein
MSGDGRGFAPEPEVEVHTDEQQQTGNEPNEGTAGGSSLRAIGLGRSHFTF